MIKNLIEKNRSYRRFYEDKKVSYDTLKELVNLARLCPSGRNVQGLRYKIMCTENDNEVVFNNIFWAGYLKEWKGPEKGERPSAYIIMLKDNDLGNISAIDEGIAAQSILLGAVEKGLGGCIIGNINRKDLEKELKLEEKYSIELVLAIGSPKETVVIEEMPADGDIKYWRDEKQVHHVPKRSIEELIID